MEEDEIEDWYESEKEKLFDEYMENIEKFDDHLKHEEEYNSKLCNLMKKYTKLMEKSLSRKGKSSQGESNKPGGLSSRLSSIKGFFVNISSKLDFINKKWESHLDFWLQYHV